MLNGAISGKSQAYCSAGTVSGKNGTIPLPSGYSRSQCKYSVWFSSTTNINRTTNKLLLQVNQSNGVVTGYLYEPAGEGYSDRYNYATVGYLIIAVK